MNILKTTPEHLRSEAGKLQLQGETLSSKVTEMISVVNEISAAGWSGDAATAYKGRFAELQDDANRMKDYLNETGDQLIQIADQYQKAEEANAQAASSLAVDIF